MRGEMDHETVRIDMVHAAARSSMNHVYSHCLVIHFAPHPPSTPWPKGITACSHAEWVASRALAERNANRWRKQPDVETIEVLDAIQV